MILQEMNAGEYLWSAPYTNFLVVNAIYGELAPTALNFRIRGTSCFFFENTQLPTPAAVDATANSHLRYVLLSDSSTSDKGKFIVFNAHSNSSR